jgi:hypothetical protein
VRDAEDKERLEYIQAHLNVSHLTDEYEKYKTVNVTEVSFRFFVFEITAFLAFASACPRGLLAAQH